MITHARFTHYERLQLLRQQQMNRKPSPPTVDEQQQAYYAVDMLLFVQCLLFAVGDLTRTLREAGMLRHAAKQAMNRPIGFSPATPTSGGPTSTGAKRPTGSLTTLWKGYPSRGRCQSTRASHWPWRS